VWTHSAWIPKLSPNKKVAKTFIREQIFSRFFQQWSFNHYGKLPVLSDYYGEGIKWFKSSMPTILKIAQNSQSIPLYADIDEYLDILQKYLPDIVHNRLGVEEGLAKIRKEIKRLDFTDLRAY